MKKTFLMILSTALLLTCAACGQTAPSSTTESKPQEDPSQSNSQTQLPAEEKTVLNGEDILWNAYPSATAEDFSLTGQDADLFNALLQICSIHADYVYGQMDPPSTSTDFMLPAFDIFDSTIDSDGNITYYGWYHNYSYYDLGKHLDLKNVSYEGYDGRTASSITISKDGSLLSYKMMPEGSETPQQDTLDIFGAIPDLYAYFSGETDSYKKDPVLFPALDMDQMLQIYLEHHFE